MDNFNRCRDDIIQLGDRLHGDERQGVSADGCCYSEYSGLRLARQNIRLYGEIAGARLASVASEFLEILA